MLLLFYWTGGIKKMKNKAFKLGKFPHNMVIDIFGKDSANAGDALVVYTEMLKRKYPDGWEKYIRVLKYYYMEGLTIVDTAHEMGVCSERARQILARNKQMLQSVSSTLFPEEITVDTIDASEFNKYFTVRATNALFRYGIRNSDDILNVSPDVLIGIRGVGRCVLGEIMKYIGQEYFNKWWPNLANKVDAKQISDMEMYQLCKSYRDFK